MATAPLLPADALPLPRGCTFEPEDWAILARYWYPVALERELGESPSAPNCSTSRS
jgi:vanillate O-demethylase monooxygenase subunit